MPYDWSRVVGSQGKGEQTVYYFSIGHFQDIPILSVWKMIFIALINTFQGFIWHICTRLCSSSFKMSYFFYFYQILSKLSKCKKVFDTWVAKNAPLFDFDPFQPGGFPNEHRALVPLSSAYVKISLYSFWNSFRG